MGKVIAPWLMSLSCPYWKILLCTIKGLIPTRRPRHYINNVNKTENLLRETFGEHIISRSESMTCDLMPLDYFFFCDYGALMAWKGIFGILLLTCGRNHLFLLKIIYKVLVCSDLTVQATVLWKIRLHFSGGKKLQ